MHAFMCQCMWHVVCKGEVGGSEAEGGGDGGSAKKSLPRCGSLPDAVPPIRHPSLFTRRVSPAWHAGTAACQGGRGVVLVVAVVLVEFSGEVEGN